MNSDPLPGGDIRSSPFRYLDTPGHSPSQSMQADTKPDGAVVYFDLHKRKDLAVRSFAVSVFML
jgi:hypothetical protein